MFINKRIFKESVIEIILKILCTVFSINSFTKPKLLVWLQDGKASSAMLVSAFLLFVGFVKTPEDAVQMFAVRRTPPGLQPSEMRLVNIT